MKFLKKQEAINFYNNKSKKDTKSTFKLFQEDIDRAGSKCFYVSNTNEIFKTSYRNTMEIRRKY